MDVLIDELSKSYRHKKALSGINLHLPNGSFTAVLGPSGCGKTTLLRCLAGFLPVDQGRIKLGDQDVTQVPPQKRGTAMVFQDYALWPHMSVYENIAYGLKIRNFSRSEIEQKIYRILNLVEIETQDVKKRHPEQYSGGQKQRIALARALVLEPKLLLLDEPLSNLDAKVRQRLRVEIRRIQKELGITAVYVTHDQDEALSMADQVVLMNEGKIEQFGTPEEIYQRPASYFAAQFIGMSNSLRGVYRNGGYFLGEQPIRLGGSSAPPEQPASGDFPPGPNLPSGAEFTLVIRSKDARLVLPSLPGCQEREEEIVLQGTLRETSFTGVGFRYWVEVEKQDVFIDADENISAQGQCYVRVPREKCYIF